MAIAKYKAKREAWLENEGLKMDREKLDLERERLKRDLGHSPKTKRATRDTILLTLNFLSCSKFRLFGPSNGKEALNG